MFRNDRYENSEYLSKYFQYWKVPLFTLPYIPYIKKNAFESEEAQMDRYYDLQSRSPTANDLAKCIIHKHHARLQEIDRMTSEATEVIWHPFAQHKGMSGKDIIALDSAYGDFFQIKHTPQESSTGLNEKKTGVVDPVLMPAFDGSASWWTQGLGHGNPTLSLAAAYAAGRYGHVMFAGSIHQPALSLANRVLAGLGNPRLKKVFFTDNGSTGVEVGIKMALRAASSRYRWDDARASSDDIGIIGLKGSYHGDTLGAMECSEPSVYNQNVTWYKGRGYWFDYPQVKMRKGLWVIEPPPGMERQFGPSQTFANLDDIFAFDARDETRYRDYIDHILTHLIKSQGKRFGALIMEPVLLGAGGMIFVDPLFQRTLVQAVRQFHSNNNDQENKHDWSGMPVIFDEVFTGLYRLGRFSAASFLQIEPDISVHAKLLTGGLLPLCVTLASESIFGAFLGDKKYDALLHGHSYTAHPIGCHVANTALEEMDNLQRTGSLTPFRRSWLEGEELSAIDKVWSMWSKETVIRLSHHPSVDSVIALGTVLAISITDASGTGK
jgi:dethiobiotin synthetase/adenosylmethionine--8-amino-7-oxononanoate aminotransferase